MSAPAKETPLERRLRVRKEVEETGQMYRQYMQTSVGGLEVGISVVVGALLGLWVDKTWDTNPWGVLVGVMFGIAAGGRQLYRIVKKNMPDEDDDNAGAEGDEPKEAS